MRLALILTVVIRLVADLATPLLPGAFRFDAGTPVEALRVRAAPDVPTPCVRPAPPDRADDTAPCRGSVAARGATPSAIGHRLPRATTSRRASAASAPVSEDG